MGSQVPSARKIRAGDRVGLSSRHHYIMTVHHTAGDRGQLMYEAFYGLREKPFSILPDPDLIYWGKMHSMAFTMPLDSSNGW